MDLDGRTDSGLASIDQARQVVLAALQPDGQVIARLELEAILDTHVDDPEALAHLVVRFATIAVATVKHAHTYDGDLDHAEASAFAEQVLDVLGALGGDHRL